MSARITFETIVTGYSEGLETEVRSFLKSHDILSFIMIANVPDEDENETRFTFLLMEGESATLFDVKEALDAHLKQLYHGIKIEEWKEKDLPFLAQSESVPAAGCNSHVSSGYADKPLGKPRPHPDWEYIKTFGQNTATGYLRDLGYAMPTQSVVSGLPEAISVTYKGVTAVIPTAKIVNWLSFVALLKNNIDLAIEKDKAIERVYFLDGAKKKFIRDIALLKEGVDYYVEETVEKKEVTVDLKMERFYSKLKSEEDLDDDEIQIIKTAFDAQKVKFKQLMATGKAEMTDEKLKDYGIKHGGLRTAILSVIET